MYIINNDKLITYIDYNPIFKGFHILEFGKETTSRTSVICHRNNYIIHFVLDGKGVFLCDNKRYNLAKGNAFLITPSNLVSYSVESGYDSWTYAWVAFNGADCDSLLGQCGFLKEPVFLYDNINITPLLSLVDKISDDSYEKNNNVFSMEILSTTYKLLENCAKALKPEPAKTAKLSESIIDTAIDYMRRNLPNNINISILCKELCISRTYFSTLFAETTRQTPHHYLMNLRTQRASELLLADRNASISEVAENSGFLSSAQFCKIFKKITFLTPSQFRNRY